MGADRKKTSGDRGLIERKREDRKRAGDAFPVKKKNMTLLTAVVVLCEWVGVMVWRVRRRAWGRIMRERKKKREIETEVCITVGSYLM
jgi:hypothetical protein